MSGFTFVPDMPENQGVLSTQLEELATYSEALGTSTGLAVLRNDRLIFEHYTGTGSASARFSLYSATKSFGAGLLVRALDDGALALDDGVCGHPVMKLVHLISMTSGIQKSASRTCSDPLWFEPGTDFGYSDGSVNRFRDVLRQHYGSDLVPLMSSLLNAIGTENWQWDSDQELSSGLRMTVRDMVRYGRLWLRGGDWDGVQILSATGTALATLPSHPSLRADYGLLWWVMHDSTPPFYDRYGFQLNPVFPDTAPGDSFLAAGCNRTLILVVPSWQLVVARSGGACVSIRNGTTQFTDDARGFVSRVIDSIAACSDGVDNDQNGVADYPADPGCASPGDTAEDAPPAAIPMPPFALAAIALAILWIGARVASARHGTPLRDA